MADTGTNSYAYTDPRTYSNAYCHSNGGTSARATGSAYATG